MVTIMWTIVVDSLMTKRFGYIMESKLSAWVVKNGRRAYCQANVRKHNSIIHHLVTLQVLMEENCFRSKGLGCYFIDFNKALDMISCDHLQRNSEELGVPSEYMFVLSGIYYQVISCVCMGDEISNFFNTTIDVKQ